MPFPLGNISSSTVFNINVSHVNLYKLHRGLTNAVIHDTMGFQHGPYECVLNTIEACAINAWPNLEQHFPVINYFEKFVLAHERTTWDGCYKNTSLNMKLVGDC